MAGLAEILESGEVERLATGFVFTEGPLWHPDGCYYFVDVRASRFYRFRPGGQPELLRENTGEGNGTTFDPQGRLVICEGGNRRLTRWPADGQFASSELEFARFVTL
jgi:gluconolactonase